MEHLLSSPLLQRTIFRMPLSWPPNQEKIWFPSTNTLIVEELRILTAFTSDDVMESTSELTPAGLVTLPTNRACWPKSEIKPLSVSYSDKYAAFNCSLALVTSEFETEPCLSALTAASIACRRKTKINRLLYLTINWQNYLSNIATIG